ncbi:HNH endonuclease [Sphingomonas crocodyli]
MRAPCEASPPVRKRRYRRRRQLVKIYAAQGGICAGCGMSVPDIDDQRRSHPDAPTFDHVTSRAQGGTYHTLNGVMKHRRCNEDRGDRQPTGCDLIWQALIEVKFGWVYAGSPASTDFGA